MLASGLLASCTSGTAPPQASASGVVPWKALLGVESPLVAPAPLPVPAGTRRCAASDLVGGQMTTQGMTGGQLASEVNFVNRSATPCRLDGPPGLVLRNSSGTVLARPTSTPPGAGTISILMAARRTLGSPHSPSRPGAAVAELIWSPQDLAEPGGTCPTATPTVATMSFTFPGGGGTVSIALAPSVPLFAPCGGVKLAGFQGTVSAVPPTAPTLAARLVVPRPVVPGRVLKYLLVLRNLGATAVDLRRLCPTFTEGLAASGFKAFQTYSLNCAAAGTIGAFQQRTFAMQFQVPKDVPHGVVDLEWSSIAQSTQLTVQSAPGKPLRVS